MITDRAEELSRRLRAEGEATLAFFKTLTPAQWEWKIYPGNGPQEGGGQPIWTAKEVLAHFVAAEKGFHALVQDVMNGGSGAEPGLDVDTYNAITVNELRGQEVDVLLGQMAMVRERSAALVAGLSPEQLARRGRHPALGESTLDEMVRVIYHHNSLHLRDVRQALKPLGPTDPSLGRSPEA